MDVDRSIVTVTSPRPASSSNTSRGTTRPGRRASATSRSNSSAVSSTTLPPTRTSRACKSTLTPPTMSGGSPAGAVRRKTARNRASSSRGENGFGT